MPKYRVCFTRKGKRLITDIGFNKKPKANAYADSINKNLNKANARVKKHKRK